MARAKLFDDLHAALESGQYVVAIFHVDHGKVHLERHSHNFPAVDLEKCVDLLDDDLHKLKSPPKRLGKSLPVVK